jgi:hypothetical protein
VGTRVELEGAVERRLARLLTDDEPKEIRTFRPDCAEREFGPEESGAGTVPDSRGLRLLLTAGGLFESLDERGRSAGAAGGDPRDHSAGWDVGLHGCCHCLTVCLATGVRLVGTRGRCPRKRTTDHEDCRKLPHPYLPCERWDAGMLTGDERQVRFRGAHPVERAGSYDPSAQLPDARLL